jgi:HPt (histidine-containing phosphotransfer) domain-containing protein
MDFQKAAEEIGISVKAYKNLCSLFIKTTKNDLQSLSEAIEAENREEIASLAHHIKGSASNMEFTGLMEEAKTLNEVAEDAALSQIRGHFDTIQKLFNDIEEQFGESE